MNPVASLGLATQPMGGQPMASNMLRHVDEAPEETQTHTVMRVCTKRGHHLQTLPTSDGMANCRTSTRDASAALTRRPSPCRKAAIEASLRHTDPLFSSTPASGGGSRPLRRRPPYLPDGLSARASARLAGGRVGARAPAEDAVRGSQSVARRSGGEVCVVAPTSTSCFRVRLIVKTLASQARKPTALQHCGVERARSASRTIRAAKQKLASVSMKQKTPTMSTRTASSATAWTSSKNLTALASAPIRNCS